MYIDREKIRLDFPSDTVRDSYITALREGFYRGNDDAKPENEIQGIEKDFTSYIESFREPSTGSVTTPSGDMFDFVPGETLWLTAGDVFIGEVSFRFELNGLLQKFGGHVGYGIRPALQGQGYATMALKLTRRRAYERGMDQLLLTCAPDNPASEKVILKNGGIYEDTQENPYGFHTVKRFWVPAIRQ